MTGEHVAYLMLPRIWMLGEELRGGDKDAGGAEPALQGMVTAEGFLQVIELAVGLARPSTVTIDAPSTCAANNKHERTARPSTSMVQAPHIPCSQPTWVPV